MLKNSIAFLTVSILLLLFNSSLIVDAQEPQKAQINTMNYQRLLNSHQSMMLIMDFNTGEIYYANEAAYKFYGYDNLESMNINQINLLSELEIQEEMNKAFTEQRNFFVFQHKLSNGQIKEVEVRSYPFVENGKSYLFSIINDRTQIVELRNRERLFSVLFFTLLVLLILILFVVFILNKKQLRLQAEQNLKLENVLQATNSISWEYDLKRKKLLLENYVSDSKTSQLSAKLEMEIEELSELMDKNEFDKITAIIKTLSLHNKRFQSVIKIHNKTQSIMYFNIFGQISLFDSISNPLKVSGLLIDESEKITVFNELVETTRFKDTLISNLPGVVYQAYNDLGWSMKFISDTCLELTGYSSKEFYNHEILFKHLIAPHHVNLVMQKWAIAITNKTHFDAVYEIVTKSGQFKFVHEICKPIFNNNNELEYIEGYFMDLTEIKQKDEKINYLAKHDKLTGLCNRWYFEEYLYEHEGNSLGNLHIFYFDIDGLKIINDAFDFEAGDMLIVEISSFLKDIGYFNDIFRVGGDAFVGISYNESLNENDVIRKIDQFNENFRYKDINMHLSYGYSNLKRYKKRSLFTAVKEAENHMLSQKATQITSSNSKTIFSILKTLTAKFDEEERHSNFVSAMCGEFGKYLDLNHLQISEFELAGMLHDIGKIAIPDSILRKEGKLDDEEWRIMKSHSTIGYEILSTANEYSNLANFVRSHHERFDGFGYPDGLLGEDIPLCSRIIAIVDAYEAMTTDRVYRKAIPEEDAIKELQLNAGTQFDPLLVEIFINKILNLR